MEKGGPFARGISEPERADMSYYWDTTERMFTPRVPVVPDLPDDWWDWIACIQMLAKLTGVWRYIDPDESISSIKVNMYTMTPADGARTG
ncbi:hypothetical protein GCM10025794_33330 [Massilia kyonggiensis]